MEPNLEYSLVGGITSVVLYPTTASLPSEPSSHLESSSDGVVFPVDVGSSSYREELIAEGSVAGRENYTVHHTLTLQCSHDAVPYGDYHFAKMLAEGVVADVALATGCVVRVGWSSRYGVAYPLRLSTTSFDSGTARLDYPLRSWVLESSDKTMLM